MFSPLSWRSFFWKSKLRTQKHYKKNLGMVGKFHLWVHVVQQQQVISITLQLWMITNTENIFCCFKMLRMRKIDLLYIPWSSEVHSPMLTLSSKEKQTWLLSTPFPYLCILLLFPRKHCLGMKYLWRHYNFYCLFCCCTTTGCMKGLGCKNYVSACCSATTGHFNHASTLDDNKYWKYFLLLQNVKNAKDRSSVHTLIVRSP